MANRLPGLLAFGLAALSLPAYSDTPAIRVDASRVTNTITRWMTGSCIEDVNHEIYGGIYDQKIFGESFEEPQAAAKFAGWTAYGGYWQSEGTGCRVDAEAGAKLMRDDPDFADGTVEVDVKTPANGGGNAGLLVHVRNAGVGADEFDGYEISINTDGRHIILGKHRHDFHLLANAPAAATPGQWHHLRVVLAGARIRVFLGNAAAPAVDYADTDNPLRGGRIALRNWDTDASFRNLSVQRDGATTNIQFQAAASPPVSGMWDPIRTGNAEADFLRDSADPFNGGYCQRIRHGAGTGRVGVANRGLNRWGIAVKKDQRFAGRIYLRAQSLQGNVTVALQSADGSVTYATQTLRSIKDSWTKHSFNLTSRADDPNARFAVWIDRPGTLWADQAILMGTGSERFHGLPVRADIGNGLVDEGITFLRYAGTMVNAPEYRWKKMIGDPDRRPPYRGHWYPYSTNGFGIFDFLNFCEAAHIGSAFAINIEETDQDAADLADYLTAPTSNPWGRRRAADGHSAPYHVGYIEIGNEEVLGGDDPAAYRHYVARFRAIAQAIHSRNPALKLVCAAWWRPESPNMATVFKALDGEAAAWDVHVWGDDLDTGQQVDREMTGMQRKFRQWNPITAMKAVIFEENGGLHNMKRALGHVTAINATRRHGDFVLADCPANCLQPWQQNDNGWDQGQLFFTPGRAWRMPPYYTQQMAAKNYMPLRVQSDLTGGKELDVLAARSKDGKTLVLTVVNTGGEARQASISLDGFDGVRATARAWILGGALDSINPPDGPEVIRPQERDFSGVSTHFAYTFPAHSDTVLRLAR